MISHARDHNSSELAGSRSRASSTSGGGEMQTRGSRADARDLTSPLNGAQSPASGASPEGVRNRQAGVAPGPLTYSLMIRLCIWWIARTRLA